MGGRPFHDEPIMDESIEEHLQATPDGFSDAQRAVCIEFAKAARFGEIADPSFLPLFRQRRSTSLESVWRLTMGHGCGRRET